MNIKYNRDNHNILFPILHMRDSFYPKEVHTIFEQFKLIFGWDAGCTTCPSNLAFVLSKIRPLVEGFQHQNGKEPEPTKKGRPKKTNNI